MRVIEFKYKQRSGELDKYIFRAICDKPLVDDKLNPEDVIALNKIAEVLSTEENKVIWIWYRERL